LRGAAQRSDGMASTGETGTRPRVFVTRRIVGSAVARLAETCEVDVWQGRLPPSPETLRERAADADALLCMLTDRIDAAFLDACPNVRAIANYAVGYDNIDVVTATARGIAIGNTPGVLTDATADLAWALLMALARRLPEAERNVRDGDWLTWEPAMLLGRAVHGATLGIVGPGRIGSAVARRAAGFDMTVLESGRSGPVRLEELLERSDYVSLHAPLTPATQHLIDAQALGRMKRTAFLINTARGGLVDQLALRHALEDGTIAGAALDVTDPEPLPVHDPLLGAPNLIVVPHVGSATEETRSRMAEIAVDNLLAALAGSPMPHPVRA